MKAVIQRVLNASLTIDGKSICSFEKGLVVFIGFKEGSESENLDWIVSKIAGLRIFEDETGKMNINASDADARILIIPNFTLYANCSHGFRPSFTDAMSPAAAKNLFDMFVNKMKEKLPEKIKCGVFGADMKINQTNDGPVTIVIDTENSLK